jgi:outer membrane usher protein
MTLLCWVNFLSHVKAEPMRLPSPTAEIRVTPMEVFVNGSLSGTWPIVERQGILYAPREAFDIWRISLSPVAQNLDFRGEAYFSLEAGAGYTSQVNAANQSLEVQYLPGAFLHTHLGTPMVKPSKVGEFVPSLFLNYDLNFQATQRTSNTNLQDMGLLAELGLSTQFGLLTTSALGRNLTGNTKEGNIKRSLMRLETTYVKDFPESKSSLVLGDTHTRIGTMGSSVYFGGVRFGTNFELAPGFVRQAFPLISGVSTVPSTVSLYIDGVLRQTSSVSTGPFTIDNSPFLTGGGEARLVVRDLLGRETVITRSFLSSQQLLATGLNDWSVEAGRLRQDLGTSPFNYGPGFVHGFWRYGLNDSLTLESNVHTTATQHNWGVGFASVMFEQWLGSGALSHSREVSLGDGSQWLLGLQRVSLRNSLFFQAQGATQQYRELGQSVHVAPSQLQMVASATYAVDAFGTVGLGVTSTRALNARTVNTLALNYAFSLGDRSSLNFVASKSSGEGRGTFVGVTWVLPLDQDRVFSSAISRQHHQTDAYATAMQNPTELDSLGWRLLAGLQNTDRHYEGGLNYLGRYGNLSADVSTSKNQSVVRLANTAALVMSDGHMFVTQYQNASYALVEVAGFGDVAIGLGSQMLTRTNQSGIALVPHLTAYQNNAVTIDPQELPISAEIDNIEQIAVPARRSVVKVVFPVRSGRGAVLKILLDDGLPAPVGAVVQLQDESRAFYVAYRGEAFVTGLQSSNALTLQWKNQQCKLAVQLPVVNTAEILRMGPLRCSGVMR